MLKGISPLLSPKLLSTLTAMGHGDEIILADAHFPGYTFSEHVIRADGLKIHDLLDAILPLFELDTYSPEPLLMMDSVPGDTLDPQVEAHYRKAIDKHTTDVPAITRLDRFEFYQRSKTAFAVVMTGETARYGNIILKKGVTPV